ncbi:MAG: hypothetical protein ICV83_20665 [Cytophagales bacterium]|nr:hypothetical protein [Cytophagales bacterium]
MKILLLSLLLSAFPLLLPAADGPYAAAMQAALTDLRNGKSADDFQAVANRLERIASAEPGEWLPAYWAAYCYNTMSFMDKDDDRRDQLLDKADALLGESEKRNGRDADVYILKAYVAQARMAISPATRLMTYGSVVDENLAKAEKLNPGNPRLYYLRGMSVYYKPEMFGGGKNAAKPLLKTALDKYAAFRPASDIHPNWGQPRCQKMYEQCNRAE